jgi:hypothetical protein
LICKACRRAWRQAHKEQENARRIAWYRDNTNVERARAVARDAFPVAKQCCVEGCVEKGERHHLDYAHPLDIVWLCARHHAMCHRVERLLA